MRLLLFALFISSALLFGCAGNAGNASAQGGVSVQTAPAPPSGNLPAKTSPASAPAANTVAVQISGFAFNPANLSVAKGTTITWTNQDSAPHTVTSTSGAFDSGTLQNGASWGHTFDAPGTYDYHCSIHSSMKGQIIVTG